MVLGEGDVHVWLARGGEGRTTLSVILGRYLGAEPSAVRFSAGPHGKPCLSEGPGDGTLRFSISHADDLALYAFARRREVGVDLERVRCDLPVEGIAALAFLPGERKELLAAGSSAEAFARLWVRREALLKAEGVGFACTPHREGDFVVRELAAPRGYAAALAVEGEGWELRAYEWRPE